MTAGGSLILAGMPSPAHPWLEHPWMQAQLDAAVAPYRGKWTERQIRIFREKMVLALAASPATRSVIEQELYRGINQSGETVAGQPLGDETVGTRVPAGAARGSKAR